MYSIDHLVADMQPVPPLTKAAQRFYLLVCRFAKRTGIASARLSKWLEMADVSVRTFRSYIACLSAAGWIEYRHNYRGLYHISPLHVLTEEEHKALFPELYRPTSPQPLLELSELAMSVAAKVTSIEGGASESRPRKGLVYLVESDGLYKVGATNNIAKRMQALQAGNPSEVTLCHTISTDDIFAVERHWHFLYAEFRVRGEWFRLSHAQVSVFKSVKKMRSKEVSE